MADATVQASATSGPETRPERLASRTGGAALDLEELTTKQIQGAYLRSELSAQDLTSWYVERIESLDRSGPELNSVNTVNERALHDAAAFDSRLRKERALRGPMDGVPVVLKDQIETAGIRTTFGSAAARDYVPSRDAPVVQLLRDAGAIILGKTSMADFGAAWFSASSFSGLTKNPYALRHDSGGSSSGTAVAVAANLAAVGVGGDTGGSVRVPASFCNIVGLRPTPGLISRRGISPLVGPQDTAGPMGRTVADVAALFETLARTGGSGQVVSGGGSAQPLRLGVLEALVGAPSDEHAGEVTQVFWTAVQQLRDTGASVETASIDDLDTRLRETSLYLHRSHADLNSFLASRPAITASSVRELRDRGQFHASLDLFEAIALSCPQPAEATERKIGAERDSLRSDALRAMDLHDSVALCFPTVQTTPPSHAEVLAGAWPALEFPTNTTLASQTGLPALSVPVGFTATGFPVGLELVGRPRSERALLAVGLHLEQVFGARRAPQLTH